MFTIGQHVWTRNFREGPQWLEGVIVDCLGPASYMVHLKTGDLWKRHVDHIQSGLNQPLMTPPQGREQDVAEQASYFQSQSTQDQQNDTE